MQDDTLAAIKAAMEAGPTPLQGGMNNAELLAQWARKLSGVEPSERDLTSFAIGVEVGFERARALERRDWDRVHHALAKHGRHPGRTDDHLADVIDRALADLVAEVERLRSENSQWLDIMNAAWMSLPESLRTDDLTEPHPLVVAVRKLVAEVERLQAEKLRLQKCAFEAQNAAIDLAQRVPREDWRPIETAPKDGSDVLLACPHGFYVAHYGENDVEWWHVDDNKHDPFPLRGRPPTHWMPLPAPPQAETAEPRPEPTRTVVVSGYAQLMTPPEEPTLDWGDKGAEPQGER